MSARAKTVRLRAYNVGFGDCLLLTVTYGSKLPDGRTQRHMLVDFGTREATDGGPSLAQIATKISEHCEGHLDVVVATHRHQDHIKGFGDTASNKVLDALDPAIVIRPWTDVPEADTADRGLGLDDASQGFVSTLEGLHHQVEGIEEFAADNRELGNRARELSELGYKNTGAIARLEGWAQGGRGRYVKAGDEVDLTTVMPRVKVQVLGPPTLAQVSKLTSYAKDSEEYWLGLAADQQLGTLVTSPTRAAEAQALSVVADPGGVGAAGWLIRRLNEHQLSQGLEIVEGFDDVLNNTSVILLVTVGRRSILLPGDAQAENWSLTLDQALGENGRKPNLRLRRQLADVEVYKVGHHGSLNATPKRLYGLWADRTTSTHPVVSVLTTKHGVYEKSIEGKVPKNAVIDALRVVGPVHSTDDQPPNTWWMDLEAPVTGETTFGFSPGEPMP